MTIRKSIYIIFLLIGIFHVLLSSYLIDNYLNPAICIPEEQSSSPDENNVFAYNLYLPYSADSVISSKVEPVVIEKNNFSEKTGLPFSFTHQKNYKQIAQYTQMLMDSKQVKTTAVYFCQLQI